MEIHKIEPCVIHANLYPLLINFAASHKIL
jgi:hypothetical protein